MNWSLFVAQTLNFRGNLSVPEPALYLNIRVKVSGFHYLKNRGHLIIAHKEPYMYFLGNLSFLRRVIVCLSKSGVTHPMTEEPYHFKSFLLQPENYSVSEGTECCQSVKASWLQQ